MAAKGWTNVLLIESARSASHRASLVAFPNDAKEFPIHVRSRRAGERRRRRFHVHAIRGELLCAARAKNIDRRRDELLAFGMAA
jgi:hypothetical protein